jgi:hypothetical protein
MRFMTIVRSAEHFRDEVPPALMAAIGQLGDEAAKAGAMVEMGGLLHSSAGARLRLKGGKITVTDGPFAEAKEVFGGFAVYDVPSKEAAIEWSRRFLDLHAKLWPAFEGEVELRQMFEMPPR